MNIVHQLSTIILHADYYMDAMVRQYGLWSYLIIGLIIFCETGLVVTPFLPGDTLLFAAGSLAAGSLPVLSLKWLLILLSCAAILGDSANFWIGRYTERRLEHIKDRWYFKHQYLENTQSYYQNYGPVTIILARFLPIIRTFAPFAAGIAQMYYVRFLCFSVTGAVIWVSLVSLCGYYFGSIPMVKDHFSLMVLAIIVLSVLPIGIKALRKFLYKTANCHHDRSCD